LSRFKKEEVKEGSRKMKKAKIFWTGFLLVVCVAALDSLMAHSQDTQPAGQCCSIVEQVLHTIDHIKKGQTRTEVEKNFVRDGGLDFRTETIYVFRLCPLIKVRIKFAAVKTGVTQPATERSKDAQDDLVEEVGQPYIQYPTKD
jgi:hypothetical protein